MLSSKTNIIFLWVAFFLLIACPETRLWAQDHSQEEDFIHFGKSDGLPSDLIYGIFQDSKGYLWLSTDNGLSRFNGYEFENFNIEDGLTDMEIFGVHEDSNGRIWIRTLSGVPCYYQNGKFYNPTNKDFLKQIRPNGFLNSFIEDSLGNVYLGAYDGSVFKIDNAEVVTSSECSICRNFGFAHTKAGVAAIDNTYHMRILEGKNRNHIFLDTIVQGIENYPIKTCQNSKNGEILTSFGRTVGTYSLDREIGWHRNLFSGGEILTISVLQDESILLGTTKGLMHYQNSSFAQKKRETQLEKYAIYAVFEGPGGNLFVGTSKGLFLERKLKVETLLKEISDSENTCIFRDRKEKLYFGQNDGQILLLDLNNRHLTRAQSVVKRRISEIQRSDDSLWVISRDGIMKGENTKFRLLINSSVRRLVFITKDSMCICHAIGWANLADSKTMDVKRDTSSSFFYPTAKIDQCFDLHYTQDSVLWGVSANGIWNYIDGKTTIDTCLTETVGFGKTTEIESAPNHVFFGTRGNGLIVKHFDQVFRFSKSTGLLSENIQDLEYDTKIGLWIAFPNGIQVIRPNNERGFEILTVPQGTFPTAELDILKITADSTFLYVLTAKEIFRVAKSTLLDKNEEIIPILEIDGSLDETYSKNASIERAYAQNSLAFRFQGISFQAMSNIKYRFRLLGLEEKWQETEFRVAQYPSLPTGSYQFEVQAKAIGGEWGASKKGKIFQILPPYWETWWFRISVVLLSALLVFIIVFLIFRSNRRRIQLEQQRIVAEHKALITQMSPHFIFNSLNSIQRFFLTNDVESGNDYLVDFGNLIRIILDGGRKTFIPLRQEKQLLELYLRLESLRLRNKFQFQIDTNQLNLEQSMIPPMLIQPFVENAIWHGIAEIEGQGLIRIQMKQIENCLSIEIEDNGIGRKRAKQKRTGGGESHRSLATQITTERISLLKGEFPDQVVFEIVDLLDENGEGCGTIVKIQLPFKNKEN